MRNSPLARGGNCTYKPAQFAIGIDPDRDFPADFDCLHISNARRAAVWHSHLPHRAF